jgi:putative membrane protein
MSGPSGVRRWISVYLKGLCMGAADTVPGVSGGTIAVILGVYERLITALTALDPRMARHLASVHTREGRAALVADLLRADVPFLLVLGAGVLSAAATVATGMHVAVTQYPTPTYAFFFGLIGASAVVLYRYVEIATPRRGLVAAVGVLVAFLVTDPSLTRTGTTTFPALFVAGAIAISAMVLPGISGAFLLLVLGQYEYVSGIPGRVLDGLVAAVGGDLGPLVESLAPFAVFGSGALVGLFSVAYAVRAALNRYRDATFAFLVSLMVGALRLPATEVATNVSAVTIPIVATIAGAAIAGVAAVGLLDRYTEELEY